MTTRMSPVEFDAWRRRVEAPPAPEDQAAAAEAAEAAAAAKVARKNSDKASRRARAGASAEKTFDHLCRGYEAAGRAWITEQSAPTKAVGTASGRTTYIRTGEAGVDRAGSIAAAEAGLSGHPIPFACDVKSSSTAALKLWIWSKKKTKTPALTPGQEREIRQRHARGEIAGVMVRTMISVDSKKVARWYWLDHPAWLAAYAAAKAAGSESMSKDVLTQHGVVVPPRTTGFDRSPDWLPVVIQLWQQRQRGDAR